MMWYKTPICMTLVSLTVLVISILLSNFGLSNGALVDNPWDKYNEDLDPDTRVRRGTRTHVDPDQASSSDTSHQRRHQRHRDTGVTMDEPFGDERGEETIDMEHDYYDEDGNFSENCTICSLREVSKQYRLEQIRREILRKLRLDSPPNITDKRLPMIPEISTWLADMTDGGVHGYGDPDDPTVKVISMLIMAHRPPENKRMPDTQNVCYFEFQSDIEPQDIVSAQLGVFVKRVNVPTDFVTMFLVYRVKPRRRGNALVKRKRIKLNNEETNKWHKFNIDAVVKNWVRNPNNNYGLQILIYDDYGESLAIVEPDNEEEELYKPYVKLATREKKETTRDKRMLHLDCTENESTKSCCRYPMQIDFAELGWDWILSPRMVDVHYCSGECDKSYTHMTYGHLISQHQTSNTITNYPKNMAISCCIPKQFTILKMLYFLGQERIQFGLVPDIVVESCSCT